MQECACVTTNKKNAHALQKNGKNIFTFWLKFVGLHFRKWLCTAASQTASFSRSAFTTTCTKIFSNVVFEVQ